MYGIKAVSGGERCSRNCCPHNERFGYCPIEDKCGIRFHHRNFQQIRKRKNCENFGRPKGCNHGEKCTFAHIGDACCMFFEVRGGCVNGKSCRKIHREVMRRKRTHCKNFPNCHDGCKFMHVEEIHKPILEYVKEEAKFDSGCLSRKWEELYHSDFRMSTNNEFQQLLPPPEEDENESYSRYEKSPVPYDQLHYRNNEETFEQTYQPNYLPPYSNPDLRYQNQNEASTGKSKGNDKRPERIQGYQLASCGGRGRGGYVRGRGGYGGRGGFHRGGRGDISRGGGRGNYSPNAHQYPVQSGGRGRGGYVRGRGGYGGRGGFHRGGRGDISRGGGRGNYSPNAHQYPVQSGGRGGGGSRGFRRGIGTGGDSNFSSFGGRPADHYVTGRYGRFQDDRRHGHYLPSQGDRRPTSHSFTRPSHPQTHSFRGQICIDFNSRKGCDRGKDCNFEHTEIPYGVCILFNSSKGCKKRDCKFDHIDVLREYPSQRQRQRGTYGRGRPERGRDGRNRPKHKRICKWHNSSKGCENPNCQLDHDKIPQIRKKVVVLVGKSGHGKSSLGNLILGGDYFGISEERVVKKFNQWFEVADTTGIGDTKEQVNGLLKDVVDCLGAGLNCLAFVFNGEWDASHRNAFRMTLKMFGEEMMLKNLIVIKTRCDDFEDKEWCENERRKFLDGRRNEVDEKYRWSDKLLGLFEKEHRFVCINNPNRRRKRGKKGKSKKDDVLNEETGKSYKKVTWAIKQYNFRNPCSGEGKIITCSEYCRNNYCQSNPIQKKESETFKGDVYQLDLIPRSNKKRCSCRGAMCECITCYDVGVPSTSLKPEKTIIVVGETGSGKTTWINGLVNCLYRVNFEDNFRFKLVNDEPTTNQAKSVTRSISVYALHPVIGSGPEGSSLVDFTLVVIDTPGFGDTYGTRRDEQIVDMISDALGGGDDYPVTGMLHSIGFVVQASNVRLTASQQYIFSSILSLFGNDMKDSIMPIFTFADANRPEAIAALKEDKVPFKDFYKFNNGCLYADTEMENYWEMGKKQYKNYIEGVKFQESITLEKTREVLRSRRALELSVTNLTPQVNIGLQKLQSIENLIETIYELDDVISETDRKKKTTEEYTEVERYDIPHDKYVTLCSKCHHTCHFKCSYSNDNDKDKCAAIGLDGQCTQCPLKCHWTVHYNNKYYFKTLMKTREITVEAYLQKYNVGVEERRNKSKAIRRLVEELEQQQILVSNTIYQIYKCVRKLQEIALKQSPLTVVTYIDMLIRKETEEKKRGWEKRVRYFKSAKESAVLIDKIQKGNDDFLNTKFDVIKRKIAEMKNNEEEEDEGEIDDEKD